MRVLLVTSTGWIDGEPGHEVLEAALDARGIEWAWEVWDDAEVDWQACDLIAVRATWDYVERAEEFLAWAGRVDVGARLLNGADVFAWNLDKSYLAQLEARDEVPTVPTRVLADDPRERVQDLADARAEFGDLVIKPRTGAGGVGVMIVESTHPLDELELPDVGLVAQPLVASVRDRGEVSVFVIGGEVTSMVHKTPGVGEIRVHEHLGGRYVQVPVAGEAAAAALPAMRAAAAFTGRPLDYGRVDLLHHDGAWRVSEVEAIEPALYLDTFADNAEPFAALVGARRPVHT
ncbi:ATP-grasp domain-containing protein [Nocardioides gilvus]|uniref:ATP-grasp domain-containing protein n=1 Tax=Nocardioides gilvus TaxID=1735589 RepID=UPI000D74CA0C|nr:hypothetical protein [Nocardioides gilvus]